MLRHITTHASPAFNPFRQYCYKNIYKKRVKWKCTLNKAFSSLCTFYSLDCKERDLRRKMCVSYVMTATTSEGPSCLFDELGGIPTINWNPNSLV